MVLKEQEKKYQLNFRHYAGDSSEPTNSSVDNKSDNACSHTGPLFEIGGELTLTSLITLQIWELRAFHHISAKFEKLKHQFGKFSRF